MTLYDELTTYLHSLLIPQGRFTGDPFTVLPWQDEMLAEFYCADHPDGAWSCARGNAKTAFTAAIACAAINGPLAQPAAEVVAVASSFEQSLILYRYVHAMMTPAMQRQPRRFRVQDSANRASIQDRQTRVLFRCIGSDPRRAHGLAPALNLLDEVAQWAPGTRDAMISALATAAGKIPNARTVWFGTRPDRPHHPFAQALAGGVSWYRTWAARPDDPPFDEDTWRKANPSYDHFPDLRAAIAADAEKAKTDPSRLAAFRALRLNLGTPDTLTADLVTPEEWERCQGHAQHIGPYSMGLDLGTSAAQSAAAAYWPASGAADALACYPANPTLKERGIQDGVGPLYEECHQRGELIIAGNRVSSIPDLLIEARSRWGPPAIITCDRWREAELRDALEEVRYPPCPLDVRAQGYKDGSADVRMFRSAVLAGQLIIPPSILLTAAASEARISTDESGNSKLAKGSEGGRRNRARDDSIAALILAVATGRRNAKLSHSDPHAFAVVAR